MASGFIAIVVHLFIGLGIFVPEVELESPGSNIPTCVVYAARISMVVDYYRSHLLFLISILSNL